MSSNKIVLTSSDGASFEVEEAVAHKLQIVSHMIDDECADKAIPLSNVTGSILAKVIEYCKKHVDDDVAEAKKEDKEEKVEAKDADNEEAKEKLIKEWDENFMKGFDLDTIFKIILAANYLNVKGLLDITCQTVADHIKDMKVEEVREIFNIENDFTEEEEAAVRKDNSWAFE